MYVQHQTAPSILKGAVIKRAVIYARVSTDKQAEYGTSIDSQVEKSLAYAASQNMEVVGIFKEEFSGTTLERPELTKVRALLRTGEIDALIIYKADRQDRSWSGVNYLLFLQELQQLGVEFHKSEQSRQIDLNDANQMLIESIEGWQAGTDHKRTVAKLHKGKIDTARNGHIVAAGHPPFGYQWAYDNSTRRYYFVIDEVEAKTVRNIFQWYVIGDETCTALGIETIARKLTELKVDTYSDRRGRVLKKMGRGNWCASMVRNILKNETYAGVWTFAKKSHTKRDYVGQSEPTDIKVTVPAIVTPELWQLAQQRREARKGVSNRKKRDYLLVGHLHCGDCGYAMMGNAHKRASGRVDEYYRCKTKSNASARKLRKCNNPYFRANKVDAAVWDWISGFILDEEKLEKNLQKYQEKVANSPLEGELKLVKDRLVIVQDEFKQALDNMRSATSSRAKTIFAQDIERIEAQLDELEKRKIDLEEQLEKQSLSDAQKLNLEKFAALMRQGWDRISRDPDSRRELLARFNIKVALYVEDGHEKARISGKITADEQVVLLENKCSRQFVVVQFAALLDLGWRCFR
ncbi:MAG: hypothetical protein FOGNACKC_04206 [Anaerolineae bacterium]|nr:hypothetical protein [Anaerolineae bacterium]